MLIFFRVVAGVLNGSRKVLDFERFLWPSITDFKFKFKILQVKIVLVRVEIRNTIILQLQTSNSEGSFNLQILLRLRTSILRYSLEIFSIALQ